MNLNDTENNRDYHWQCYHHLFQRNMDTMHYFQKGQNQQEESEHFTKLDPKHTRD